MNQTDLHQRLDHRGLLNDAHGTGCYALRLDRPADLDAAWDEQYDARPDNFARLTEADELLYCGAATNVYERLTDHVAGEVRRSALLRVCSPVAVVDVTPTPDPFDDEYRYALSWADSEIAVWVDGEIL